MFHESENLFFGRRQDGSVRVLKFAKPPQDFPMADAPYPYPDAVFDQIIDAPGWASIVCSVSRDGETGERWDAAQNFHGRQ